MKHIAPLLICVVLLSSDAVGDDALGGAKEPKPDISLKRNWQSKRVHQLALRYILLGRLDDADSFLNDYLKDHPDDAETHYMLGVLLGQQGQIEQGVAQLEKAVELGLPTGRIVAGPREVMQPLADTKFVRQLKLQLATTPVHGPMVGEVTDTSASIWVRLSDASNFNVKVTQAGLKANPLANRPATVTAGTGDDFTSVFQIDGLQPDTTYHYTVVIEGVESQTSIDNHFRTMPEAGKPSKFSLAFGGGAGYVPENERMWDTIESFDPRLMLTLAGSFPRRSCGGRRRPPRRSRLCQ